LDLQTDAIIFAWSEPLFQKQIASFVIWLQHNEL